MKFSRETFAFWTLILPEIRQLDLLNHTSWPAGRHVRGMFLSKFPLALCAKLFMFLINYDVYCGITLIVWIGMILTCINRLSIDLLQAHAPLHNFLANGDDNVQYVLEVALASAIWDLPVRSTCKCLWIAFLMQSVSLSLKPTAMNHGAGLLMPGTFVSNVRTSRSMCLLNFWRQVASTYSHCGY
jgi:hypothetical protein